MGHGKFDQSEKQVLDSILARVATFAPPPGTDIETIHAAWPNQAGRDYLDAVYRPKPIVLSLSDDLVLRRQWFLISVAHVVTADDAAALVRRAALAGLLDAFEVRDGDDFFGLSRRQPTRLARFVATHLAPQLNETPVACTAEFLIARAALLEAGQPNSLWPPAFTQPDQRHAIEVELLLLAESTRAFTWQRCDGGRLLFTSLALSQSFQSSTVTARKANEKLAAAETKIRQLTEEIERLKSVGDDSAVADRFKRSYRKHVLAYHPDKLMSRPETERRVGEEVTRILNAFSQEMRV